MQKIEFNDLGAQYRHLKADIDAGIADVIAGCHFISGPQTVELEKELCSYTGRKYCVTTSNGTDALQMPLMAKGIGEGDAVFVPALTFFATAEVVSLVGATPVFCDAKEDTFNMDPASLIEQIEKTLREGKLKPKAVIAVDLFGQPAEFDVIESICKRYNLMLMEDAAQGSAARSAKERPAVSVTFLQLAFSPQRRLAATAMAARFLRMTKKCTSCLFPSVCMEKVLLNMKMCVLA